MTFLSLFKKKDPVPPMRILQPMPFEDSSEQQQGQNIAEPQQPAPAPSSSQTPSTTPFPEQPLQQPLQSQEAELQAAEEEALLTGEPQPQSAPFPSAPAQESQQLQSTPQTVPSMPPLPSANSFPQEQSHQRSQSIREKIVAESAQDATHTATANPVHAPVSNQDYHPEHQPVQHAQTQPVPHAPHQDLSQQPVSQAPQQAPQQQAQQSAPPNEMHKLKDDVPDIVAYPGKPGSGKIFEGIYVRKERYLELLHALKENRQSLQTQLSDEERLLHSQEQIVHSLDKEESLLNGLFEKVMAIESFNQRC